MKTALSVILAFLGAALFGADVAQAQIPQFHAGPATGAGGPTLRRNTRSPVSAYTGLLGAGRSGNGGFGYQYFTRVQPQQQASRAIRNLSGAVNQLESQSGMRAGSSVEQQQQQSQQQGATPGTATIGPTGHTTGNLTHTRFFATNASSNRATSSRSTKPY